MRDIFTEIFENQPLDPMEAARRAVRPNLRKRFYETAHVGEGGAILLDGKPVKTPARRMLNAPTRELAEAIAGEWNSQSDVVDPARMPLTRLANAIIDAVCDAPRPVADEIEKYLRSDLVCLSRGGACWSGRKASARMGSGPGLGTRPVQRALRAGARCHARRPAARIR